VVLMPHLIVPLPALVSKYNNVAKSTKRPQDHHVVSNRLMLSPISIPCDFQRCRLQIEIDTR
jgi:hypothetical protein